MTDTPLECSTATETYHLLRVSTEPHITHNQAEIVLKESVDNEGLWDEDSFRAIESVFAGQDDFEQHFGDAIFHIVYNGRMSEEIADNTADNLLSRLLNSLAGTIAIEISSKISHRHPRPERWLSD